MNKLLNYIILPREITETELAHVQRINQIALVVSYLHVPVFVIVAYLCGTGIWSALMFSALILMGPTVAYKTFKNPRHLSLVYGFASMCLGALLVHLGQGPAQIEMHFHFFVFLALLAVYGNPMSVLVAAVTVALHHIVFWLFLPRSVFNYDASFWVIGIHALFVVLESIASCFIARSFFDNVIGLEKIIQTRTEELDTRNQEMKIILDNAGEGFLTAAIDGHLEKEKSAIVEQWLGLPNDKASIWEYFGDHDQEFSSMLKIGFEDIKEDFMPLEVVINQMPRKLSLNDRTLGFSYKPIQEDGKTAKILIVISDITAEMEKAKFERDQKEIVQIFECMNRDRVGFFEYLDEAKGLISRITAETHTDPFVLKRDIHTLKGNSGVFGITSIFDLCHDIESHMAEVDAEFSQSDREALLARWNYLSTQFERLTGGERKSTINVDEAELLDVLDAIKNGSPVESVAHVLDSWRHEPTRTRLLRIAEQAKAIAERLQKGEVTVTIDDNRIRLPQKAWSPFWTTFVHVVRNAVDHGLETPEKREETGKPEGRIDLRTAITDGKLIIEIQDNGRGLDWGALEKKCKELNLPHSTHSDLAKAIFIDGVSTKSTATLYSGRGVGMSAVKEICKKMGGHINIVTQEGKGTRFTFTFPLAAAGFADPKSKVA